jgi:hypothetical protein
MKRSLAFLATLVVAANLGGCIVEDQLTKITIHPDGSADYVLFRSNVRSTEKGAKAEKELADYKAKFDAQEEPGVVRIRDCGGKIIQAAWVRSEPPYSSILHARFPDASSLQKFGSAENEDGSQMITTRFHRDGARCKLVARITIPEDSIDRSAEPPEKVLTKQVLANGFSQYRFAVANGSIVDQRGFTVASDKQSALLDLDGIEQLVQKSHGSLELFLEWDVAP